jgi:hypothetical protein
MKSVPGQSLPKWAFSAMSALPPIATELRTSLEVCLVPTPEVVSEKTGGAIHLLFGKAGGLQATVISLLEGRIAIARQTCRDAEIRIEGQKLGGRRSFAGLFCSN